MYVFSFVVAGEPNSLNAISHSNSTRVNINVTWESPDMGDPVTGYVIYYQPEGGAVSSDMVSGGETETHLLDGLQRGVTYNISIVALSLHLPSPMVGPVNASMEESYVFFCVWVNIKSLIHPTLSYLGTFSFLYTSYK